MINVLKLPQYLAQLKFIQLTLIDKITSYFFFINLITANFQVFLVCGLTLWMNVYTWYICGHTYALVGQIKVLL